ncbi:MAG: hypothetical protein WKF30_03430 [Pyrinomonadaceae bacterium]
MRRWLRGLTGAELEPTSVPGRAAENAPQLLLPARAATLPVEESPRPRGAPQMSIAILPFRNMSADPQVSFYEFSLADAVITELGRISSLVVRPSSVIVKYQGQVIDPLEAGRELRVKAILASSFLRVGERLRVTTQLLDVSSGALVWSDRIDAAALDIITLQDTISRHIVDGLRVELTSEEQSGIGRQSTRDAIAYEEYLRGRAAWAATFIIRFRTKIRRPRLRLRARHRA